jgi:hypothetical protein
MSDPSTGSGQEGMQTEITVLCAYCQKFLGVVDGKGVSGISHGVCDSCLKNVQENIQKEIK